MHPRRWSAHAPVLCAPALNSADTLQVDSLPPRSNYNIVLFNWSKDRLDANLIRRQFILLFLAVCFRNLAMSDFDALFNGDDSTFWHDEPGSKENVVKVPATDKRRREQDDLAQFLVGSKKRGK